MVVTQLLDVIYIVCYNSSAISRFNATTHEQLEVITVKDLRSPCDIVACEITSQLYVADFRDCVWRVSPDGADIKRWLPKSPTDTFEIRSMSVRSGRLLLMLDGANEVMQFDADGKELRRVQLPDKMEPLHAVESPTGTFIVKHCTRQLNQCKVSEVDTGGRVLRQFTVSTMEPIGYFGHHVAVDSHGNVFVFDTMNYRVLVLDDRLSLRRVIIDEHQLNYEWPQQLCYVEQSGQLLVVCKQSVIVFDVLCCYCR